MPPEDAVVTTETPTPPPITANSPEARNPDGSLKENLSSLTTEPKPNGEIKSTEPAPAEPKAPEPKAPESAPKALEVGPAPEKYEFKNLPDGFEVTPDAEEFFKKMSLTQAQADEAVQFYIKKLESVAKGPYEQWKSMQEEWLGKVKADPEYKGNLDNVRSTISKFLDQVDDSAVANEMREAMDFTGAGNNPAFVKFMFRMAQRFTEGGHVKASGPSPFGQRAPGTPERPTVAKSMYPTLP